MNVSFSPLSPDGQMIGEVSSLGLRNITLSNMRYAGFCTGGTKWISREPSWHKRCTMKTMRVAVSELENKYLKRA